jgi:hypothetical protein
MVVGDGEQRVPRSAMTAADTAGRPVVLGGLLQAADARRVGIS